MGEMPALGIEPITAPRELAGADAAVPYGGQECGGREGGTKAGGTACTTVGSGDMTDQTPAGSAIIA